MIRVSATLAKKTPIPGQDYSSLNVGASIDLEIADSDRPEAIQGRMRELYLLLNAAVDEQICNSQGQQIDAPANGRTLTQAPPPAAPAPVPVRQPAPQQRNGYTPRNRVAAVAANGNGNSNGRSVTATAAQQRAIFAIAKSLNLDLPSLLADYNCSEVAQLHIRDASKLIDDLKARQVPQA